MFRSQTSSKKNNRVGAGAGVGLYTKQRNIASARQLSRKRPTSSTSHSLPPHTKLSIIYISIVYIAELQNKRIKSPNKTKMRILATNFKLPNYKNYCTPAKTYLILAVISIAYTLVANVGTENVFKLGTMKLYVQNSYMVILFEIFYLMAWGWFIDWLCRKRETKVAWFIVLLPYILGILAFMGFYRSSTVNFSNFS